MWWFERGGERIGPIDEAGMRGAVQSGQVNAATLVWRQGFAGWVPAGQTELAPLLGGPPPVPVASPWQAPAGPPGFPPTVVQPYAGYQPPIGAAYVGVHYAGFWIRAAAYLIDAALLAVLGVVLNYAVGFLVIGAAGRQDVSNNTILVMIGSAAFLTRMLVTILYVVLFWCGGWQATPGKKLLGLRVVTETGEKLRFWRAVGRYLSYIVSALIFGFGFFMIGWTQQKRGLHDMMAGTRVIHARR